jgi:hypothetical protein
MWVSHVLLLPLIPEGTAAQLVHIAAFPAVHVSCSCDYCRRLQVTVWLQKWLQAVCGP